MRFAAFREREWWRAHGVLVALGVLLAASVIRAAWLADDAFISFRTIDNFLAGHGLRWNLAERVQTYTHPLWLLVLAALIAVTRDFYFTPLVASLVATLAAAWIVVARIASSRTAAALALLVLCGSKAFVEYSTSGLENPLTHLLIALFVAAFLRLDADASPRRLFGLALIVGMAAVNRLDSVLLFAPALLWVAATSRSWRGWLALAAGSAPLLAWLLFSFFYYGFPFPNTAYAKLGSGIDGATLAMRGLAYLESSLRTDPLTLVAIAAAAVTLAAVRAWRLLVLVSGALLYLLYVIKIGGDFMSGRFLTAPLLLSVAGLAAAPVTLTRRRVAAAAVAIALLAALTRPHPPLFTPPGYGADREDLRDEHRVTDERRYYYPATGLWRRNFRAEPTWGWAESGKQIAADPEEPRVIRAAGFRGFFAGPEAHLIDAFALGDPLLARLPAFEKPSWTIGHFERHVPDGYLETVRGEENRIADPDLAAYYDRLRLVTRGPLWSWQRLRTAIELNLGVHDHLIDETRYRHPHLLVADLEPVEGGWRFRPEQPARLQRQGAELAFPEPVTVAAVRVTMARGRIKWVRLARGDELQWEKKAGWHRSVVELAVPPDIGPVTRLSLTPGPGPGNRRIREILVLARPAP